MSSWSPYNYTFNNPLRFIDPNGMAPFGKYYDGNGNEIFDDGIDDGKVYLTSQETVDNAKVFEMGDGSTGQIIQSASDTYELGTENEFGLIQLTGMGNSNIRNNAATEDTYSYVDSNGNLWYSTSLSLK